MTALATASATVTITKRAFSNDPDTTMVSSIVTNKDGTTDLNVAFTIPVRRVEAGRPSNEMRVEERRSGSIRLSQVAGAEPGKPFTPEQALLVKTVLVAMASHLLANPQNGEEPLRMDPVEPAPAPEPEPEPTPEP
jgi:hypothetical protein